jgi:hypothetical protein
MPPHIPDPQRARSRARAMIHKTSPSIRGARVRRRAERHRSLHEHDELRHEGPDVGVHRGQEREPSRDEREHEHSLPVDDDRAR